MSTGPAVLSRPVVRPVDHHPLGPPAQRLLDRGFLLVVRALYGIDVVLRILGDDRRDGPGRGRGEPAHRRARSGLRAEARPASARHCGDANGHQRGAALHRAARGERCTSPPPARPVHRNHPGTRRADDRHGHALARGVLSNSSAPTASYEWRTRLLRTGRRIIDIERRARASAAAPRARRPTSQRRTPVRWKSHWPMARTPRGRAGRADVRLATDQGVKDAALADSGSIWARQARPRRNTTEGGSGMNRLLRLRDVEAVTGLKHTTIYTKMAEGDFPARVRLGVRAWGGSSPTSSAGSRSGSPPVVRRLRRIARGSSGDGPRCHPPVCAAREDPWQRP